MQRFQAKNVQRKVLKRTKRTPICPLSPQRIPAHRKAPMTICHYRLFQGERPVFTCWAEDVPGNYSTIWRAQEALDLGLTVDFKAIAQQLGATDVTYA